ncbi:hypothetical protein GCM10027072_46840 [Streptomyces bullii]
MCSRGTDDAVAAVRGRFRVRMFCFSRHRDAPGTPGAKGVGGRARTEFDRQAEEKVKSPMLGNGRLPRTPRGGVRGIDRPKRHRAMAARYDRLAVGYEATVLVAGIDEWL